MAGIEKQINQSLPRCPKFKYMIDLPLWYKCGIEFAHYDRKRAKRETQPEYFSIEYANFLAACFRDRKYIDDVFNRGFKIEMIRGKSASRQVQVCKDIGLTLCYLGYHTEGIKYLEKAVELIPDDNDNPLIKTDKIMSTWLLCSRLNHKEDWDKRLEYIKAVEDKFGKTYVDKKGMNMDGFLIKTYIDKKMFKKAEDILVRFAEKELKYVGFLWAELYFTQGNFKASADAFERYTLPKSYCSWRSQYDYRKALAYYYSDQQDKCRRQVARIKSRMKWDRFYQLDVIEKVGIERVPAIDKMIQSDDTCNFLFDKEKTSHYLKTMIYFSYLYLERRWYVILLLILLIFFLTKLVNYLL